MIYVLLYFYRKVLPWQGIRIPQSDRKFKTILKKKRSTFAEELVGALKGGDAFWEFLQVCKETDFEVKPDYERLKEILRNVKDEYCQPYRDAYEW